MEMTEKERYEWRLFLMALGLLGLCAALIQLGAMVLVLNNDISKAECRAGYWQGVAQKQQNYCPPGCVCDLMLFR
ncbi:hypothetical protein [Bradyrhizobium tunisiense]|jgi:uncharacterized membrane protein|uniref:hypothetical protein n=1 Tax=Bradyrhizobium tunisiense TaxID=3278709 RepID=UPI0035DEC369